MDENAVLYKCPYCVSGRFTKKDGWNVAVQHIRKNHTEKSPKSRHGGRGRRSAAVRDGVGIHSGSLFDEEPAGE